MGGGFDAVEVVRGLEAEVARLRERCAVLETCHAPNRRVEIAERDLAAERAAHEATKAELAKWQRNYAKVDADMSRQAELAESEYDKRVAAEQRVAELERDAELHDKDWASAVRHYNNAHAALCSARKLLETAAAEPVDWWERRDAWLRAHPEPATPAATGAERRCKRCGMLQSECDLQRIETPDPFESAEKERET